MPPFRNRRFLDLAHRAQTCQLELSEDCEHHTPNGCEPAHSNQQRHGKGMGIKADDYCHAASCRTCHDLYDGRTNKPVMTWDEKQEAWQRGFERTMKLYLTEGWLKVVG